MITEISGACAASSFVIVEPRWLSSAALALRGRKVGRRRRMVAVEIVEQAVEVEQLRIDCRDPAEARRALPLRVAYGLFIGGGAVLEARLVENVARRGVVVVDAPLQAVALARRALDRRNYGGTDRQQPVAVGGCIPHRAASAK